MTVIERPSNLPTIGAPISGWTTTLTAADTRWKVFTRSPFASDAARIRTLHGNGACCSSILLDGDCRVAEIGTNRCAEASSVGVRRGSFVYARSSHVVLDAYPVCGRTAENWSACMASNPSDVSNAPGQAESTDADQKTPSICPACQHSMESHDPLGVRFCAVTADRGLDRKCICAADREEMQHYSRY